MKSIPHLELKKQVIKIDGVSHRIPTKALELNEFLGWVTRQVTEWWTNAETEEERQMILGFAYALRCKIERREPVIYEILLKRLHAL